MRGLQVVLSPEARDDLQRIRAWYTQQGAGPRAKQRLLHVLDSIEDIAAAPNRWPIDPEVPGTRYRVVEGHFIRYAIVTDPMKPSTLFVHRIFGPGMQRAPW